LAALPKELEAEGGLFLCRVVCKSWEFISIRLGLFMSAKQDCYFHTDKLLPIEEQLIKTMCVNCFKSNPDNAAWFWEGSKAGYGPFDFICSICGHVIHKGKK
jgi:hypothetical protein